MGSCGLLSGGFLSVWPFVRVAFCPGAVLLQGGPHDAAVNFGTYRSLQRHRAVFTAIAALSN